MGFMYKGQEIPTGGGQAQDIYSTEEQRIGTWIDGKDLYQKSFVVLSPPSTVDYKIVVDASYLQNFVIHDLRGYINSTKSAGPLNFTYKDTYVSGWEFEGSIYMATNNPDFQNAETVITIQYTKTTDQPTSETQLLSDMEFDIASPETAATASIMLGEV